MSDGVEESEREISQEDIEEAKHYLALAKDAIGKDSPEAMFNLDCAYIVLGGEKDDE